MYEICLVFVHKVQVFPIKIYLFIFDWNHKWMLTFKNSTCFVKAWFKNKFIAGFVNVFACNNNVSSKYEREGNDVKLKKAEYCWLNDN